LSAKVQKKGALFRRLGLKRVAGRKTILRIKTAIFVNQQNLKIITKI